MRIDAVDVGLVSATDALVAFYERALGAEPLEPRVFPFATVHRLACGPLVVKVMVPAEAPAHPEPASPFWARAGLRYLTLWVDDLDALVAAWAAAGGAVTMAATALRPGVRTALLADPDGNVVEAMEESTPA